MKMGRRGKGVELFLSTPSARRATSTLVVNADKIGNFYPRPPRGERHLSTWLPERTARISIHALREESDLAVDGPRHPVDAISIHALREESDLRRSIFRCSRPISIHALREESDHGCD
mgnify:FL=1